MPFSKGQWIFAAVFLVSFILVMAWAYLRDKRINRFHYKGAYRVFLFILLLLSLLFLFVKLKS